MKMKEKGLMMKKDLIMEAKVKDLMIKMRDHLMKKTMNNLTMKMTTTDPKTKMNKFSKMTTKRSPNQTHQKSTSNCFQKSKIQIAYHHIIRRNSRTS